jgi:hypothetical protein
MFIRADLIVLMESAYGFTAEAVVDTLITEEMNQFSACYKMLEKKYPEPLEVDEWSLELAWQAISYVQTLRMQQSGMDVDSCRQGVHQRHRAATNLGQHEYEAGASPVAGAPMRKTERSASWASALPRNVAPNRKASFPRNDSLCECVCMCVYVCYVYI